MLGYTVLGPDIDFNKGDDKLLLQKFKQGQAFQDYPWCFEWHRFTKVNKVKFIMLYRDSEQWWKSFLNSYGNSGKDYLSYPYINIPKQIEHKNAFLNYYTQYYEDAKKFIEANPDICLNTSVMTISWDTLCGFLNEAIPKNVFGRTSRIPHVNKKNYKFKNSHKYRFSKFIKQRTISLIGLSNYLKFDFLFAS